MCDCVIIKRNIRISIILTFGHTFYEKKKKKKFWYGTAFVPFRKEHLKQPQIVRVGDSDAVAHQKSDAASVEEDHRCGEPLGVV